MAKAVFIDYTGTILQERGEDLEAMIRRVASHSRADRDTILAWWWKKLRELEYASFGDSYMTEEEICLKLAGMAEKEWGLRDNPEELLQLNKNYWINGPLFSDVQDFFRNCPLPIYIITNISDRYVRIFLKRNDLHVNGIICGDMVKAYKPRPEIFRRALEISGSAPEETVHIGDSVEADAEAAQAAGLIPLLLDRPKKSTDQRFRTVYSLTEALKYL